VVLHGIGEPLLNPELAAMIRYVKTQHPRAAVVFNSNAILLDDDWQTDLVEAELDQFRVSLDAATAATYARIRGINAFDKVVDNVRRFAVRLGDSQRPQLSLWTMAMRENLDELPALVDLSADLGVLEVYVQRLVLFDQGMASEAQSLHGRLRAQEASALDRAARRAQAHRLAFRASGLTSPQDSLSGHRADARPYAACYRMWTTTYITANGNVLPCCIAPFSTTNYAGLVLGNVFLDPFAEIWNGERYVARRRALYTSEPLHPCELCGVNWAL
jgi:MoaA/NifB/PqqE/SkfB family radical SAM enzyme